MIHIRIHKPTPPLKGTGPMATVTGYTGYYTRQAIWGMAIGQMGLQEGY